jgi:hypothetical protein
LGKSILQFQTETPSTKIQIDVSGLKPGIYFIKATGKAMENSIRFIKK